MERKVVGNFRNLSVCFNPNHLIQSSEAAEQIWGWNMFLKKQKIHRHFNAQKKKYKAFSQNTGHLVALFRFSLEKCIQMNIWQKLDSLITRSHSRHSCINNNWDSLLCLGGSVAVKQPKRFLTLPDYFALTIEYIYLQMSFPLHIMACCKSEYNSSYRVCIW